MYKICGDDEEFRNNCECFFYSEASSIFDHTMYEKVVDAVIACNRHDQEEERHEAKLVKTFIDDQWAGYQTMKEVVRLRNKFNRLAIDLQKSNPAEHRVFCHYDIDCYGEVVAAWFYSDETYSDERFDRLTLLSGVHIWALHARH